MTPTEYAQTIATDTMHHRPSDDGYVVYLKAHSELGTIQLELSADKTYGAVLESRDYDAHDFLWETCEELDQIGVPAKFGSRRSEVAA